jgi:hypothetical protein
VLEVGVMLLKDDVELASGVCVLMPRTSGMMFTARLLELDIEDNDGELDGV